MSRSSAACKTSQSMPTSSSASLADAKYGDSDVVVFESSVVLEGVVGDGVTVLRLGVLFVSKEEEEEEDVVAVFADRVRLFRPEMPVESSSKERTEVGGNIALYWEMWNTQRMPSVFVTTSSPSLSSLPTSYSHPTSRTVAGSS